MIYIYCISGFCREVDEKCVLVGYYAANNGNFLPTLRDSLSAPSSRLKNPTTKEILTFEDGTDRLSCNVGNKLSLIAA
jgi:hypothetical protein